MNYSKRINLLLLSSACLYVAGCSSHKKEAVPQYPNFVWLLSEDISPHFMGLYNNGKGACTPNVEKLASEGIVFNNAYSNAPVSSAARSTLITGCYAPRLGIGFHRKLEAVPLPEGLRMFPSFLREAGYYTSNSTKTDYNCLLDETAWDNIKAKMGDWRNRPDKSKPFFFMRTNAATHESRLHFKKSAVDSIPTRHKPEEVNILPFHPDTKIFRYTYATLYDRIADVDDELGKIVEMLRHDNELDNTFIFYFGDNGGCVPGSKGYTGETGLKVPLVVYIPAKWRNRIPIPCGSRVDGFVSFMDFGPTLLHLAGIDIPEQVDGKPFLGTGITLDNLNTRDEVYCYGDRYDELYAFNRTVRKGNFKYVRNFLPCNPKSLYNEYRYKQLAFREWKELYERGQLNDIQKRFFEPQGAEELYNLADDPCETVNLAGNPACSEILRQMKKLLYDNMTAKNDLSIMTESAWLEEGKNDPAGFGMKSKQRIDSLIQTADLQTMPFNEAKDRIKTALTSHDPIARLWALTACSAHPAEAAALTGEIQKLLNDPNAMVQSHAAVFLTQAGKLNPVKPIKKALKKAQSVPESLWILNNAAYLNEAFPQFVWNLKETDVVKSCGETDRRCRYFKDK